MGREIPQGRGSGWPACGLVPREKASALAGGGRAWPGGCPEVSLTRLAQASAGSVPCGPSVLPGECPAGISPPPAPWKGKHQLRALGWQLHRACLGGRASERTPEDAHGGSSPRGIGGLSPSPPLPPAGYGTWSKSLPTLASVSPFSNKGLQSPSLRSHPTMGRPEDTNLSLEYSPVGICA